MTKTLKPVLALSIAALTLLAGCAKGDANTAWSATKKDIKSKLQVKSWDKCAFLHYDLNKFLKTDGKDASEEDKAEMKKDGNTVSLTYVFTLKDGSVYTGTASYSTKSKELNHAEVKEILGTSANVYSAACSAYETTANEKSAYCTYGILVK